jgi:phosphatidylinositol-3-phosphatase
MSRMSRKSRYVTILSLVLLATLAAFSVSLLAASATEQGNSIQPFSRVFYIMMENNGVDQIVGNPNAPFINQLITSYGYDNNYYGVTHDSLPNYVAAISGNNWYSYSDNPTQTFNHTNLVDQLVAHNISWKAYMESMPSAGFTGYWYLDNEPPGTLPSTTPSNALYSLKHDPFLLFTDITSNPQLADNVVPLTQLTTDLNSNDVPQFVWISPNLCNDMHGQPIPPAEESNQCPYSNPNALYADGDNFLKTWVTAIMDSKAWTGNSVIFITWDETAYPPTSDASTFIAPGPDAPTAPSSVFVANGVPAPSSGSGVFGGGNVPLIVIARLGPHPLTINTWADHYSILRTIEESWNLATSAWLVTARRSNPSTHSSCTVSMGATAWDHSS